MPNTKSDRKEAVLRKAVKEGRARFDEGIGYYFPQQTSSPAKQSRNRVAVGDSHYKKKK